ncbi:hypothetical protein FSP39_014224 [Pinctada imbricata]|uniref:CCHC-type domain-containing protein n=1 Tax=Pinctada imbricata TaxID=66713 RepID=A0AA89BP88_PINIB|nr:hypothetical protein FSP39_014224 [Pinctada imbricata]
MTEFTEDELKHLGSVLKELKIKPKADTAADFKQWMTAYVAQMDKDDNSTVKTEPGTDTATPKITTAHHIPKVSCFSGDGSKQDTTYDLWRYEIDCLILEKYSEASIAQAIRRSLRGDAGKVAMRLGPEATVSQILEKMESVFGTVERGETIMQEFYSAIQGKNEDCMSWSCRLEEIYRKAVVKGVAKREESNEKLRSKFWNGLHQWLRDITGYKFDKISDFDTLRKEVRLVEKEHETKKAQSNMAVSKDESTKSDDISELKGMIQQLTTKVNYLEKGQQKSRDSESTSDRDRGHFYQKSDRGRGTYTRQNYRGGFRGNYRGGTRSYGHESQYFYPDTQFESYSTDDGEPICYRCRQSGHLARGCRVILDHSKRGLNFNRPSSRGKR